MTRETHDALVALFTGGGHEQVVAVAHEAARPGRGAPLPDGLHRLKALDSQLANGRAVQLLAECLHVVMPDLV